jgi:CMP-N-acetylneuraminic acid synthetase
MSTFAIIPAKGRSTRLPGEDIKNLAGVPLVERTVNTLLASQQFDQVWVSTDSMDIADLLPNKS